LSKCDALTDEDRETKLAALKKAARRVPIAVSAASGENVEKTLRALMRTIDSDRTEEANEVPAKREATWRP
jgi:GTP-binding protein